MTDMILYSGPGNASERVLWVLNYKSVPYREQAVEAEAREAYLRINPFGYVPTLQVGEQCIAESVAIVEYLEECFPHPSLLPGSALERAQIREVYEAVNSTIHPPQNRSILMFLRPDLDADSIKTL